MLNNNRIAVTWAALAFNWRHCNAITQINIGVWDPC